MRDGRRSLGVGRPAGDRRTASHRYVRDGIEFVATLADRLYHTIMPVMEGSVITAYVDDLTFWGAHPDLGGVPCALWNIAALQAAEWVRKETGTICELRAREPLV